MRNVRPVRRRADILPGAELDRCVTGILAGTDVPLGAYDIAAALRGAGRHAVVASIYRSLERLRASGAVEKVETCSAFRIRDVPEAALMVCSECGVVAALPISGPYAAIARAIAGTGFTVGHIALEATGLCRECGRRRGA